MKNIQMVDLKGQYSKIKNEVDAAMQSVIESCAFINGPEVKSFQTELENYLQVKHVIPCANGTDALQMAMMALDLQPGDEVITSSFTFVATAEVIALLQLVPVVVDVDPDTFNVDIASIEKAITPKTKAIVPVHLFGQCANMEKIMALAEKHQLFVIEDACQSIGADYIFNNGSTAKSGTIGHLAATSFFPSKNLGCFGDGGAVFTNDDALAGKLRMIANHGMKVRYYHDSIGVNSRLDSLQAAVLRIKLKNLDVYNQSRRTAADFYDKAFSNVPQLKTPIRASYSTHVFHQYTLVTNNIDRFALQEFLQSKGIPSMVYYPVPLHLQKAYENERYKEGDFPVTENLCRSVISLPMHTELDNEQLDFISKSVLNFLAKE
jgi:UDP-2-acetamido-2-deoxy-ribo-hexuluronate aminotransferase